MKWAIGNCLFRLTSRTGVSIHKTAQLLEENNDGISELYFAKSKRVLINTADTGRFAGEEVTVIYLSFTDVRVSITLPGNSVLLEGGTRPAQSRKYLRLPLR